MTKKKSLSDDVINHKQVKIEYWNYFQRKRFLTLRLITSEKFDISI